MNSTFTNDIYRYLNSDSAVDIDIENLRTKIYNHHDSIADLICELIDANKMEPIADSPYFEFDEYYTFYDFLKDLIKSGYIEVTDLNVLTYMVFDSFDSRHPMKPNHDKFMTYFCTLLHSVFEKVNKEQDAAEYQAILDENITQADIDAIFVEQEEGN